MPLTIRTTGPVRRLLMLTKWTFEWRLDDLDEEVRSAHLWLRPGIPTKACLSAFRLIARNEISIRFLADLDPGDLATYRAYQCGSPDMALAPGRGNPIALAGITSEWMELSEQFGTELERMTIRMSRLEREQYRALRKVWPELPDVVGGRALELLESGRKLEVEGATAVVLQNPAFRAPMLDLLFGDAERRRMVRTIRFGREAEAIESAKQLRPNDLDSPLLIQTLEDSGAELHNRIAAICALGNADEQPVWDYWRVGRDKTCPPILRGEAIEALAWALLAEKPRQPGRRHHIADLIALLDDPSPHVRFWSAFALATLRARDALPRLKQLAREDKARVPGWWSVRKEAADAIVAITTGRWPRDS